MWLIQNKHKLSSFKFEIDYTICGAMWLEIQLWIITFHLHSFIFKYKLFCSSFITFVERFCNLRTNSFGACSTIKMKLSIKRLTAWLTVYQRGRRGWGVDENKRKRDCYCWGLKEDWFDAISIRYVHIQSISGAGACERKRKNSSRRKTSIVCNINHSREDAVVVHNKITFV